MLSLQRTLFAVLLCCCAVDLALAEPSAADGGFRICTQNLFRYGDRSKGGEARKARQRADLIERFQRADCDVVAVQEVYGETPSQANATLAELADAWSASSGEKVKALTGDSIDPYIRSGFLVRGRERILSSRSFGDEPLPRLQPLGPVGRFLRAPVLLVVEHPEMDGQPRRFAILNIHLKSKSYSFKDPTGTSFETVRMEMAEGVRNIVRRELKALSRDTTFVLVGDRNSDLDSATAELLDGERVLSDFTGGHCRLDSENEPQCGDFAKHEPELIGLFALRRDSFPVNIRAGATSIGANRS